MYTSVCGRQRTKFEFVLWRNRVCLLHVECELRALASLARLVARLMRARSARYCMTRLAEILQFRAQSRVASTATLSQRAQKQQQLQQQQKKNKQPNSRLKAKKQNRRSKPPRRREYDS